MMKAALALSLVTLFTTLPAHSDFSPAATAAQASAEVSSTESFVRPWFPGRPGPGRRCIVRDRFRGYNNLNGCLRNSPAPRTCRKICR